MSIDRNPVLAQKYSPSEVAEVNLLLIFGVYVTAVVDEGRYLS